MTYDEDRFELGVYPKRGITLVRGEGARVWDDAGNEYLDAVAGVGVAFVGHAHPRVVAAVREQAGTLMTAYSAFHSDVRGRFLAKLATMMPPELGRYFLCNSGTEAVEGAIKFARLATGRTKLVAAVRGYHGKTLGALSATFERAYRDPIAPLLDGVTHVPLNKVDRFVDAIDAETAAVIVEPIQGEGGIRECEPEFLRAIAAKTAETGALLIADEVQSGCGRTGAFLASSHADVVPDIVTLAKAIGGGVPLGVVACGPRVGEIPPRMHTSTFGGNPLACAAGLATLEAIDEERLVDRAGVLGDRFRARLIAAGCTAIRSIRGRGLMIGVELKQKAGRFLQPLADQGVLAMLAGNTVLRFLPPAVITDAECDRLVDALVDVLTEADA